MCNFNNFLFSNCFFFLCISKLTNRLLKCVEMSSIFLIWKSTLSLCYCYHYTAIHQIFSLPSLDFHSPEVWDTYVIAGAIISTRSELKSRKLFKVTKFAYYKSRQKSTSKDTQNFLLCHKCLLNQLSIPHTVHHRSHKTQTI